MRKLNALPVALLCFTFGTGCDDSSDSNAPGTPATNETYRAPLDNPSNGSTTEQNPTDSSATTNASANPPAGTPSSEPGSSEPGSSDPPAPSGPQPVDPGPAPTETCQVSKDSAGFFTRQSSKSEYVAYVPASYSPKKPMRVIVGLHGCGDSAMNFATWGVNPYQTRATQTHIGISVGGETGANNCWNKGGDDDKVMAAVDDLAKCFWIDRGKIIVAGFSSGGELAYRVGMKQSASFAGVLIENSSLSAAGDTPASLLKNAGWKLPIAHRAHTSDAVFPIDEVKADWSLIKNAGFPLATSEVAGDHNGTGDDWANWIIPQSASWGRTQ
jgi:predicted esterase